MNGATVCVYSLAHDGGRVQQLLLLLAITLRQQARLLQAARLAPTSISQSSLAKGA